MPGKPQPLFSNQAIVDAQGFPTQYFVRWAQQRQIDIAGGITAEQAQALIDDWAAHRAIHTDGGLEGGGTLDEDRTLSIAPTGVSAGAHGDATHFLTLTIGADGRITDFALEEIAVQEAPMDGQKYARQNGAWVALP